MSFYRSFSSFMLLFIASLLCSSMPRPMLSELTLQQLGLERVMMGRYAQLRSCLKNTQEQGKT